MPLNAATISWLDNDANVPSGRHVVDSRARDLPQTQYYSDLRGAACENWAIRALQPTAIDPPAVFNDILLNPSLDIAGLPSDYATLGKTIKANIRRRFGDINNYLVHTFTPATRATRNGAQQDLHDYTVDVFELCLAINGFVVSAASTDYMVCMEYERAPDQPIYPNFTHAWLMYKGRRIIQTVPGADISISRHEAGRQPHCGFIRRYVDDFHANQINVIQQIVTHPMQATNGVTGCNLAVDVAPPPVLDARSPNE